MERFTPSWWCRGPHAQTLWASLRPRRAPRTQSERLELPDGDFLDLSWIGHDQGPLVIVLHGLTGSVRSPYAKGMLSAIAAAGWRGCLMHFRGCSDQPNRLARSYHSGETGDLTHLVQVLHKRNPDRPMAAVGYSIGGNVLLKYLGEKRADSPLSAAVAISVPYDLALACRHMENGLSRLYQWNLVRQLRVAVGRKMKRQDLGIGLEPKHLRTLRTFRTFDHRVTAPLHGFASADDYYRKSSSRAFLKHIQTPTLLLHAEDDPFMHPGVLPKPGELSPEVTLELSAHGGHVGFVQGSPWRPTYWLEKRIPQFLRNHLPERASV